MHQKKVMPALITYQKHSTINSKISSGLNIQVFIMFIECIQLVNSTTMISLTKNDENVFLNIFLNPLSDRGKKLYLFVTVLTSTFLKMNF